MNRTTGSVAIVLAAVGIGAAAYHGLAGAVEAPTERSKYLSSPSNKLQVAYHPQREAFFGEMHLHTTHSLDAYVAVGTRTTPDQAYRFARGEAIDYLGQSIRIARPLDFIAISDHAENMGVFNQLDDPNSELSRSPIGQIARGGTIESMYTVLKMAAKGAFLGAKEEQVMRSAWQRNIDAANANYRPGRFTSFIAYEWTSMPGGKNLHRNVIFRGDSAPMPFSAQDSAKPEDLWAWLDVLKARGIDTIAIPHNPNASDGLMFDWVKSDGMPIDWAYARLRSEYEPLLEVIQMKGASETHPLLSPNDEFASFEIEDKLLDGRQDSKPPGSYWRDGLGRGLKIGSEIGINPFKVGAVGSSDLHSGITMSDEWEYGGKEGVNLGGGKYSAEEARQVLSGTGAYSIVLHGSPGLTGVWANANTRDAIFTALRRKETFATSGTRIRVRFFGGWNLPSDLLSRPNWVKTAYETAVPMGGDFAEYKEGVPTFAVEALKDPLSGNLDRVQIIKVWLENGERKERIFDVAWSGDRRVNPKTGKLPAIGNTVDLKTGKYANSIGATHLSAVWQDPKFDPALPAVYYARVLEIPTPRWTTLRALENGLPIPANAPPIIQERALTSPIWFTPRQGAAAN